MSKRPYRQNRRAEQAEQTRARITEAVMQLHQELGPARTTIKAVAERAGVQRLTVYRHFEDERAMFKACTSLWAQRHPLPDPAAWQGIKDAATRTRTALAAFYGWYRRGAPMLRVSYRDIEAVPALAEQMAGVETMLDNLCADLLKPWAPTRSTRKPMQAALRHGLSFTTWESLASMNISDTNIATMFVQWLRALSKSTKPATTRAGKAPT
jgi:AcrR family transcriptional regulator